MSPPTRTAYVADRASASVPVACAVIVEGGMEGLRDDVRDIVAESATSAARQTGGYEPTFGLLLRLHRAPVQIVVTRPRPRPPSHRSLLQVLVADRVEMIVMRQSPPIPISDGDVPAPVRVVQTDVVHEPLLNLPTAVAWAYHHDLQHPGQKRPITRPMADRMRVIDVG